MYDFYCFRFGRCFQNFCAFFPPPAATGPFCKSATKKWSCLTTAVVYKVQCFRAEDPSVVLPLLITNSDSLSEMKEHREITQLACHQILPKKQLRSVKRSTSTLWHFSFAMQARLPHPPLQMPLQCLGVGHSHCDCCVLDMTQYDFLLTIGILCLYLEKSAAQMCSLQSLSGVKGFGHCFKTPLLPK